MFNLKKIPAAMVLAGASVAFAYALPVQAAELVINGTECGQYSSANFSTAGKLTLSGDFTCFGGEGVGPNPDPEVKPDPDPDPEIKPDPDPDPETKPDEPGEVDTSKHPKATDMQLWSTPINSGYKAITLSGVNDYVVQLNPTPNMQGGYGLVQAIHVAGMNADKVISISTEPGDYTKHVAPNCVSDYGSLNWSYIENEPRRPATHCKLQKNTVYYLNIRHAQQSSINKTTCTSGVCGFYVGYVINKNYDPK